MSEDLTAELILLGVGGAFDADRGVPNTNVLLEVTLPQGKVWRILLDCGHTCGHQLHQLGLGYEDIDEVLITHTHGDHMDGLEVMGYKSRFLHHRRPPLLATPEVMRDIWAALRPKMGALQDPAGELQEASLASYFEPIEVASDTPHQVAQGHLHVSFVPVVHVVGMPCHALLFRCSAKARPLLRWSGDTIFTPEHSLFQNLDPDHPERIFHDCIFFPYYPGTVHTHFDQLKTLPQALRERLVLVHHGKSEAPEPLEGMHLGQALERYKLTL